jgi:hypothetical protein
VRGRTARFYFEFWREVGEHAREVALGSRLLGDFLWGSDFEFAVGVDE